MNGGDELLRSLPSASSVFALQTPSASKLKITVHVSKELVALIDKDANLRGDSVNGLLAHWQAADRSAKVEKQVDRAHAAFQHWMAAQAEARARAKRRAADEDDTSGKNDRGSRGPRGRKQKGSGSRKGRRGSW